LLKHFEDLLKVLVVVAKNENNNFLIINVQNVVLYMNAKKVAVKCHFCMIYVTCVRKDLFIIIILGSIE